MNDNQTSSDAEYAALWAEYQAALLALRLVSINLSLANSEGHDLGGYGKLAKDAVEAALKRAEEAKGMNSCDALRIVDGVTEKFALYHLYNSEMGQVAETQSLMPSTVEELNTDFEADGSSWRWIPDTASLEVQ